MTEAPHFTELSKLAPSPAAEALIRTIVLDQPITIQPDTVMIDAETAAWLRTRRRIRKQNGAQRLQPAAQPSSRRNHYRH